MSLCALRGKKMETFFSFLERRVDDCSSLFCVGLDPHVSLLPEASAEAALDFCLGIVKETSAYAAAFKPNAAFFEFFGAQGWDALSELIAAIKTEGIPVILDAKRGDIASTADAYAKSAFEHLGADCITLNPYLGKDSIDPFIGDPEKGAFLLCKTSNPGSDDLQNLMVDERRMTEDEASSVHRRQTRPELEHQQQHRSRRWCDPARSAGECPRRCARFVVSLPGRRRPGWGFGNRSQSWSAGGWQRHAHQRLALDRQSGKPQTHSGGTA